MNSGSRLDSRLPTQEFLPDSRIEVIWNRLHREIKNLPEDTQFATTVQPAQWVETKDGLAVLQPEAVIFWAVVPNPQPRWKDKNIKQFAMLSMDEWRKAEMTKWRFAGAPDPAYVIFRALCLKLIDSYKNWMEMN